MSGDERPLPSPFHIPTAACRERGSLTSDAFEIHLDTLHPGPVASAIRRCSRSCHAEDDGRRLPCTWDPRGLRRWGAHERIATTTFLITYPDRQGTIETHVSVTKKRAG
jgi:hypothetical protein